MKNSRAARPCSLGPNPLCLVPPNGTYGSVPADSELTCSTPTSSRWTACNATPRSRVKTAADRPWSLRFASPSASSASSARTRGLTVNEVKHKVSLRASVTSELVLDGVRLPGEAVLPGARGLSGPLGCLNEARFGIVFGAMGAALDCLETAIAYAADREVFARPLSSYQLTQEKLADMALELGKGLLLAVHLGRLKEAGALTPEQVSAGKLNNVREALEIARTCRTLLGASGITLEYPVIRHAVNLESVLTYEGTSEIHTLVLGKALTGIAAFH